jgi:hypothetical protein
MPTVTLLDMDWWAHFPASVLGMVNWMLLKLVREVLSQTVGRSHQRRQECFRVCTFTSVVLAS